jgi:hypothetical protein
MKKTLTVTLLLIIALSVTACGNDDKTPDPVLCDCAETYGEYTHLDEGETCDCGGEGCKDCTLKVNATLSNGTTKVWKEVGVSVNDFNTVVGVFNAAIASVSAIGNNVTEVHVKLAKTGISHNGTIVYVGCDETLETVMPYLALNGFLQQ